MEEREVNAELIIGVGSAVEEKRDFCCLYSPIMFPHTL